MKEKSTKYFPVLIDLSRYPALVIGGGTIAYRKVMNLLEFNGEVTVITPELCDELMNLIIEKNIVVIRRKYQKSDIKGYKLVFASTGDEDVDKQIYDECLEEGALLNVADVPELCNFIMPAFIKKGDFTVAVSSQGHSPFFVKSIKDKIESSLPKNIELITELAGEFRNRLMKENLYSNEQLRNKLIDRFLKTDWDSIINENGIESARHTMNEILMER
ncbi:MAG: bifunctional precorrin-2 dehydrogenase/sirohydrochlorin ferrochelatase [Ignavibacteriae bacterium]|nr:bifunctional precorrin-2 dehydrogenase/sirohydrochlorin ferrochelatase [Ignavibacteriota bacterium]